MSINYYNCIKNLMNYQNYLYHFIIVLIHIHIHNKKYKPLMTKFINKILNYKIFNLKTIME